MLEVALGLFVVVLGLLYYYLTSTFSHWKDKGVNFIKPYPLVGSMSIGQKSHLSAFFQQAYQKFDSDPFVGFFMGRTPSLIMRDPELIKHILVKDFNNFSHRGVKLNEEVDPLQAKSLIHLEGQCWKDMRSKLTPTFTTGRIKAMFPLALECAEELEKHLGKLADTVEDFDIKDVMARYTTDVIGSCAFGVNFDSINNPNCQFRAKTRKLTEPNARQAFNRAVIEAAPAIARILKLRISYEDVTEFFRYLVRDVMAMRARTGETRKDFMQLLIELKDKGRLSPEEGEASQVKNHVVHAPNDKQLTFDDVTAQAATFFNAGFNPSSTALTFAMFELSRQPELQRKARRQIEEVLQRHGGKMTYEALQDMKYLDWIIRESLRKYPPFISTLRACTKKYLIPGTKVTIEEGTKVIMPVFAMHRDPKFFPDPEKFDPERFSDDEKQKTSYMPFGEGPRNCIGIRFARMQTSLGLASVLRQFEIRSSSKMEYPVTFDPRHILLVPKQNITVRATRV